MKAATDSTGARVVNEITIHTRECHEIVHAKQMLRGAQ